VVLEALKDGVSAVIKNTSKLQVSLMRFNYWALKKSCQEREEITTCTGSNVSTFSES